MTTFIDSPFHIDSTGRTATHTEKHAYAKSLIEAVLFTAPGERVNRPQFGSGIYEMLFDANNEALETAADFMIRSSIQQFLSDVVTIDQLTVRQDEGTLEITLSYRLRGSDEQTETTFTREIG